jgi:hypothetical protein
MEDSAKRLNTYGAQELMIIRDNLWYAVGKNKFP